MKINPPDEYIARAMLLGMKCSKRSWAFYRVPETDMHVRDFYHPVTLEKLSAKDMRKRHEALEMGEDPDKVEWLP